MAFTVWVDADACPKAIKEVLFRAADRRQVQLTLIANQFLRTPPSPFINSVQVAAGFDVADNTIVERLAAGDLVNHPGHPTGGRGDQRRRQRALPPRHAVYEREHQRPSEPS